MTGAMHKVILVLFLQIALGAVPGAGLDPDAHRGQPQASQKAKSPPRKQIWMWAAAIYFGGYASFLLGKKLLGQCQQSTTQSYETLMESEPEGQDPPPQLGSLEILLRQKVILLSKGLAGVIFRNVDIVLDIIAGCKFWLASDRWWSSLTFSIILLSPLPQYMYVKWQRGWGATAISYLIPGNFAHTLKEILHLRFISKLPQHALFRNMHKMAASSAMNEILAGIESAFESLPQGCVQARAYYIKGGDWVNLLSITTSFCAVGMGVFLAFRAFSRKVEHRHEYSDVNEATTFADGQSIDLAGLPLDSQIEDALLWLAVQDQDCKTWNLSSTTVSDTFVKELARRSPGLTGIYLSGTEVTDNGIQELAQKCPGLKIIDFNDTQAGDAAVQELARNCPGLTKVFMADNDITDEPVKELARNCPGLTTVDLNAIAITDAAWQELAKKCPGLTEVYLFNARITDATVEELARNCPGLTTVIMGGTDITDSAVLTLAEKCPGLHSIDICRIDAISDAALKGLARNCPELRVIYIWATQITEDGVWELLQKCPKLKEVIRLDMCDEMTEEMIKQRYPAVDFSQ